jgi:hypothetical protein
MNAVGGTAEAVPCYETLNFGIEDKRPRALSGQAESCPELVGHASEGLAKFAAGEGADVSE